MSTRQPVAGAPLTFTTRRPTATSTHARQSKWQVPAGKFYLRAAPSSLPPKPPFQHRELRWPTAFSRLPSPIHSAGLMYERLHQTFKADPHAQLNSTINFDSLDSRISIDREAREVTYI